MKYLLSAQSVDTHKWITRTYETKDDATAALAAMRMEFARLTPRGAELPVWGKMHILPVSE